MGKRKKIERLEDIEKEMEVQVLKVHYKGKCRKRKRKE